MADCWIKIDKDKGSLNTDVKVSYGENDSGQDRTATIEVVSADGTISKTCEITQVYKEVTVYWNSKISGTLTRNNCLANEIGGQVTFTVPAHTFASYESQKEAQDAAQAEYDSMAQKYANEVGTCVQNQWCNEEEKCTIIPSCPTGYEPSGEAVFTLEANTHCESSEAALSAWVTDALAKGCAASEYPQEKCVKKDVYIGTCADVTKTRNDCAEGGVGSSVTVKLSDILLATDDITGETQEEADRKACLIMGDDSRIQAYVNTHGTCTWTGTATKEFTPVCPDNGKEYESPTSVMVSTEDSVVTGKPFTSTVSQAEANKNAAQALTDQAIAIQTYVNGLKPCTEKTKYRGSYSKQFTPVCPDDGNVYAPATPLTVSSSQLTTSVGYPFESYDKTTADNLAKAAVEADGQKYANDHYTCTLASVTKVTASKEFTAECPNDGKTYTAGTKTVTTDDLSGMGITAGPFTYPDLYTDEAAAKAAAAAALETNKTAIQTYVNGLGLCTEVPSGTFKGSYTLVDEACNPDCGECKTCDKCTIRVGLTAQDNNVGVAESYITGSTQEEANQMAETILRMNIDLYPAIKAKYPNLVEDTKATVLALVKKNCLCKADGGEEKWEKDTSVTPNPFCKDGKAYMHVKQTNQCLWVGGVAQEKDILYEGSEVNCSWTGTASKDLSVYKKCDNCAVPVSPCTHSISEILGVPVSAYQSNISQADADAKAAAILEETDATYKTVVDDFANKNCACTASVNTEKTIKSTDAGTCSGCNLIQTIYYNDYCVDGVLHTGETSTQSTANTTCQNSASNWNNQYSQKCSGCTRLYVKYNNCTKATADGNIIGYNSSSCDSTWTNTSNYQCSGCNYQVQQKANCSGTLRWSTMYANYGSCGTSKAVAAYCCGSNSSSAWVQQKTQNTCSGAQTCDGSVVASTLDSRGTVTKSYTGTCTCSGTSGSRLYKSTVSYGGVSCTQGGTSSEAITCSTTTKQYKCPSSGSAASVVTGSCSGGAQTNLQQATVVTAGYTTSCVYVSSSPGSWVNDPTAYCCFKQCVAFTSSSCASGYTRTSTACYGVAIACTSTSASTTKPSTPTSTTASSVTTNSTNSACCQKTVTQTGTVRTYLSGSYYDNSACIYWSNYNVALKSSAGVSYGTLSGNGVYTYSNSITVPVGTYYLSFSGVSGLACKSGCSGTPKVTGTVSPTMVTVTANGTSTANVTVSVSGCS